MEKLNIAKQYLVPRQIKENGLKENQIEITDDAINLLTGRYTREAGVRQLERTIGNLARKVALKVAQGDEQSETITPTEVRKYLGSPRFYPEKAREENPAGVATGMAWTEMGGEVLFIEATALPGGSGLTLTGQLGDVMKESAQAARSYLWSHAAEFNIPTNAIKENGVHLHVPAGAIPKDGPSAGVTMASALASLYTGRKVRSDTAMTGEITLSGLVFPVGGIKEKVLAAHRAGIRRIILPDRNEADTEEIPEDVLKELEIIPAMRVSDVLNAALEAEATAPLPRNYTLPNVEQTSDGNSEPLIAKEKN
jgi:ATP-dependent Lon protease